MSPTQRQTRTRPTHPVPPETEYQKVVEIFAQKQDLAHIVEQLMKDAPLFGTILARINEALKRGLPEDKVLGAQLSAAKHLKAASQSYQLAVAQLGQVQSIDQIPPCMITVKTCGEHCKNIFKLLKTCQPSPEDTIKMYTVFLDNLLIQHLKYTLNGLRSTLAETHHVKHHTIPPSP